MINKLKGFVAFIKKLFHLHVDIPTAVLLLLGFLLVHRPLAKWIFSVIGFADTKLHPPDWVGPLVQSIFANLISAVIIIPVVFWMLRIRSKAAAAGRFNAYDLTNGTKRAWGEVALTYNLFSNRVKGTITHNSIVLQLEAVFERGQYLRGHYIEKSNAARRRMGSFLLLLTGEADAYEGPFVFVDPQDQNAIPQTGSVRWERIPD